MRASRRLLTASSTASGSSSIRFGRKQQAIVDSIKKKRSNDFKLLELQQRKANAKAHLSNIKVELPVGTPDALEQRVKGLLSPYSLGRITNDFTKLQEETANYEQGQTGARVPSYDSRKSVAYLAFRFIPAFGVVKTVLQRSIEAGFKLPNPEKELSVLDFGSGPATASWAAYDAFEISKKNMTMNASLVEPSLPMIDAAAQLARDKFEVNWCRNIVELARSSTKESASRFDLVLATFSLGDLPSLESRNLVVDLLWNFVAPNGLLLVVERGNARGAGIIGSVREQILRGGKSQFDLDKLMKRPSHLTDESPASSINPVGPVTKPKIIAPCGHEGSCPLAITSPEIQDGKTKIAKKSFCHFAQATFKLLKMTKADQNVPHRMAYSYIAVEKRVVTSPTAADMSSPSFIDTNNDEVSKNVLTEIEEARAPLRILRKPKRNVRHVVLDLCAPGDSVKQITISHSQRTKYRIAKGLQWGDLFRS